MEGKSQEIHSPTAEKKYGGAMSIWVLILIIVVVVFLLGGFGYRRRR